MEFVYLNKRTETQFQGTDYAAVYNPEFYIRLNHSAVDGLKEEDCFEHFLTIGMSEGRTGSPNFNPNAYRYNYPELELRYGNDNKAYYIHFLHNGMREGLSGNYDIYKGKSYQKVFDYYYYSEFNPDVTAVLGKNPEKYIEHFVEYGMNEGRMACQTFDVHAYKYRHDKFYVKKLESLRAYFIDYLYSDNLLIDGRCSVYGGRDYLKVYSYAYYKANNDDVREALGNNASLYIKHFVEHGMQEGRSGNGIFDVFRYRMEHPELVDTLANYLPSYYLDYIKKNERGEK